MNIYAAFLCLLWKQIETFVQSKMLCFQRFLMKFCIALQGSSRSRLWYAVLDYGTNYCNLRNLMDGAFPEQDLADQTSVSQCTQYDERNCARF